MFKYLHAHAVLLVVSFIIVNTLSLVQAAETAPRTLVYALPNSNLNPMSTYQVRLLQAALNHSGEHFVLKPAAEAMVQSRALKEITDTSQIDLFWSMTSEAREKILRPIRIPIDKGLLGWRLLLVKEQGHIAPNWQRITAFRMVQGHDWPDTEILRKAGFKVDTSADFNSLFNMIEKGRADAMPRSVNEIQGELATIANKLNVEPGIMLYYPAAQYFFVAKHDDKLALALEYGLKQIIQNGVFDQLFNEEYGDILQQLQQEQRRIIKLDNPLLPKGTPLHQTELWQPLPSNDVDNTHVYLERP